MSERNLEEEHFKRIEAEQKAKLREKLEHEAAEKARAERKALHHHRCGKCGELMNTKPFRGIEIEVCPACGAVLLDPGELQTLAGADRTEVFSSLFSLFGSGRSGS